MVVKKLQGLSYFDYNQLNKQITCCCAFFSNRSQMTSNCGKNKKVAPKAITKYVTHFDTLCDLVLNRCLARIQSVSYNKETKYNDVF